MFSHFDPATGKTTKPQTSIVPLGELVAGQAKKELDKRKKEVTDYKLNHNNYLKEARIYKKYYTQAQKDLEVFEKSIDSKSAIAEFKDKWSKSHLFTDGLIEDIQVIRDRYIFATTADLFFYPGLPKTHSGITIKEKTNIGRFLIIIEPLDYRGYLEEVLRICNLSWRMIDKKYPDDYYHHPFIYRDGKICFGKSSVRFEKAFKNNDYIELLELCLALLTTHHDHEEGHGVEWRSYFERRVPLVQAVANKQPYWTTPKFSSLQLHFDDPKKTYEYNTILDEVVNSPEGQKILNDPNYYTLGDAIKRIRNRVLDKMEARTVIFNQVFAEFKPLEYTTTIANDPRIPW